MGAHPESEREVPRGRGVEVDLPVDPPAVPVPGAEVAVAGVRRADPPRVDLRSERLRGERAVAADPEEVDESGRGADQVAREVRGEVPEEVVPPDEAGGGVPGSSPPATPLRAPGAPASAAERRRRPRPRPRGGARPSPRPRRRSGSRGTAGSSTVPPQRRVRVRRRPRAPRDRRRRRFPSARRVRPGRGARARGSPLGRSAGSRERAREGVSAYVNRRLYRSTFCILFTRKRGRI